MFKHWKDKTRLSLLEGYLIVHMENLGAVTETFLQLLKKRIP
jgi:hypothetical protein